MLPRFLNSASPYALLLVCLSFVNHSNLRPHSSGDTLPVVVTAHRALNAMCWTFILLHFAVLAKWPYWWGGHCWGPRLATEILPFAIVLVALAWRRLQAPAFRPVIAVFVLWGVFTQVVGVYFSPGGNWDTRPVSIDEDRGRLWHWRDNPVWRSLRAGPRVAPYVIVWTAFAEGAGAAQRRIEEFRVRVRDMKVEPRLVTEPRA